MLIDISRNKLYPLTEVARKSDRQRVNYNFHTQMNDPINRMVHAMQPGTYVQPHKHQNPDKREIFLILEGSVAVIEFNDQGEATNHVILDSAKGVFGVEIPVATWHTIIVLKENTLVYEFKDGPYSPIDDKNFASWAPSENGRGFRTECQSYLKKLIVDLKLQIA